uniref:RRM domain-containing protein n=1 Tax=Globodera pallida TaxID=36090 RepID=A0A183C2Z0_GLOPA
MRGADGEDAEEAGAAVADGAVAADGAAVGVAEAAAGVAEAAETELTSRRSWPKRDPKAELAQTELIPRRSWLQRDNKAELAKKRPQGGVGYNVTTRRRPFFGVFPDPVPDTSNPANLDPRTLTPESGYDIVVEHDLTVLDYLSDSICLLYGVPGAYGVVTLPSGVREGINQFMDGFIPSENMRFRNASTGPSRSSICPAIWRGKQRTGTVPTRSSCIGCPRRALAPSLAWSAPTKSIQPNAAAWKADAAVGEADAAVGEADAAVGEAEADEAIGEADGAVGEAVTTTEGGRGWAKNEFD